MNYSIERFDKKKHNRNQFECEEEVLTSYLKNQLSQDEKRGLSKAFVLYRQEDAEKHVKGFYTLSAFAVNLDSDEIKAYQQKAINKGAAKLPNSLSTPSILIGRLARHTELKGTQAGDALLSHALQTVLELSQQFGVHFIVVDAKNDFAKRFYRKFGFIEFNSATNRMYLPVNTISQTR